MPSRSVLVIGGGLAGLSCAVALAEAGYRICLLEKRPHLGGRATSYMLPDGSEVDNCQHVTLGCCTNLSDFYGRAGASDKIRFYTRLCFADKQGRRSTIEASAWLPPPLHMAPSFLFFRALALADKRSIARALMTIARSGGNPPRSKGISMLDWLGRMKQTPAAVERYWRVVLVSALDEELSRTDARYGIEVFWKAFLANRRGCQIGIPTVPLAELYEGCREAVVKRDGEVRTRSGVREISIKDNRFAGAVLEDGSAIEADACVCAVPHTTLLDLIPKEMGDQGGWITGIKHIKTSPITGVHLWFDRRVMDEPFLTLLDHTTQWVFNKTVLYGRVAADKSKEVKGQPLGERVDSAQYLQLVISASYELVQRSRQDIVDLCRRELAEVLPASRQANLVKSTVVKDVNATFSPEPGVDRWRPGQDIGAKNFFLAGDWTCTEWPSTMEGAVRSGYLAAEAVAKSFQDGQRFLRPNLPVEGLSRYWAERRESSGND